MSIKKFNQRIDKLLTRYYQERREIWAERDAWIGTQWPLYKSGRFSVAEDELDQWNCKDSPIGICIYDDEEDPCHDMCHFCGQPEERK